jgi:hypothetical protein
MVFDSANPTGGDDDLGTPNEDFSGPGIGDGGGSGEPGENNAARGKVLIISQDGNSTVPNDRAGGGTIIITFTGPVQITTVGMLDIDESGTRIRTFSVPDGGSATKTVPVSDLDENSWQTVSVDQGGVRRLQIELGGSGAVTDFTYCFTEELPSASSNARTEEPAESEEELDEEGQDEETEDQTGTTLEEESGEAQQSETSKDVDADSSDEAPAETDTTEPTGEETSGE